MHEAAWPAWMAGFSFGVEAFVSQQPIHIVKSHMGAEMNQLKPDVVIVAESLD